MEIEKKGKVLSNRNPLILQFYSFSDSNRDGIAEALSSVGYSFKQKKSLTCESIQKKSIIVKKI